MKLKLSKNKIEKLLKGKYQTKRKFKNKQLQRVSSFRKRRALNLRNKSIKPIHKIFNKNNKYFNGNKKFKNYKNLKNSQDGGGDLVQNIYKATTMEELFNKLSTFREKCSDPTIVTSTLVSARQLLIKSIKSKSWKFEETLLNEMYQFNDTKRGLLNSRLAKYCQGIMGINAVVNDKIQNIATSFETEKDKEQKSIDDLDGTKWLNEFFGKLNYYNSRQYNYLYKLDTPRTEAAQKKLRARLSNYSCWVERRKVV